VLACITKRFATPEPNQDVECLVQLRCALSIVGFFVEVCEAEIRS
jgi:hypothetical protein